LPFVFCLLASAPDRKARPLKRLQNNKRENDGRLADESSDIVFRDKPASHERFVEGTKEEKKENLNTCEAEKQMIFKPLASRETSPVMEGRERQRPTGVPKAQTETLAEMYFLSAIVSRAKPDQP
jgi:hypothetical protein